MPKNGFLTPKAIANRIKAKGLQKLRWYCQMCQKQCRDENGFKCHTTSESHQRQLLLFAENPNKYIDQFSQEFLDDFMQLLKRRFGTKRVHANQVYQEYIADRNHLHMNATEWETLTDFVKWLGREGHCIVDETEKGWFVSYIDRDPETIQRQESQKKQEKMKLDDEERNAKFFQRQMERDKQKSRPLPDAVYTELKKGEDEKIAFSLKLGEKPKKPVIDVKQNALISATSKSGLSMKSGEKPKKSVTNVKQNPVTSTTSKSSISNVARKSDEGKKRKFALDEIMEEEKSSQEKKNRKDYWLAPGIVVKVLSKRVGEEFYKRKAVVTEVEDNYYAYIKAIDFDKKTVAHQKDLETVIPAVGRKVLILNGAYRGCEAILSEVNFETFSVKVKISSGTFKGKVLDSVKYEDVSKLDVQS